MNVRGLRGPVWYCAVVLVIDVVFALVRPGPFVQEDYLDERKEEMVQRKMSTRDVLSVLALTAVASFSIRIAYPIGTVFRPLGVQLGYTPQYVLYYTADVCIHHRPRQELHSTFSSRKLVWTGGIGLFVAAMSLCKS